MNGKDWRIEQGYWFSNKFGQALILIGVMLYLVAIFIVGSQVILWLDTAEWSSLSTITILQRLEGGYLGDWVHEPESWLGVWEILSLIPFSLSLAALATVLVFWGTSVREAAWKERKRAYRLKQQEVEAREEELREEGIELADIEEDDDRLLKVKIAALFLIFTFLAMLFMSSPS